MINEDVRHIIEPELLEGEELLWAERVDPFKKDNWIINRKKELKSGTIISILMGCFFLWIIIAIISNRHFDSKLWIVLLGSLLLAMFALFCFYSAWIGFTNIRNPAKIAQMRPFDAYGLSNKRLLYIGQNKILKSLDASNIKKAKNLSRLYFFKGWTPLCLTISPVSGNWLKFGEIYFLTDFKKSEEQLNRIINKRIVP